MALETIAFQFLTTVIQHCAPFKLILLKEKAVG